jgi:hypothetical protein
VPYKPGFIVIDQQLAVPNDSTYGLLEALYHLCIIRHQRSASRHAPAVQYVRYKAVLKSRADAGASLWSWATTVSFASNFSGWRWANGSHFLRAKEAVRLAKTRRARDPLSGY